jgi:hypothetical protein
MNIVMTVTIHVNAILMVGIAVHLMQLLIGINIVKNVNALSLRFQVKAFEFIFFFFFQFGGSNLSKFLCSVHKEAINHAPKGEEGFFLCRRT